MTAFHCTTEVNFLDEILSYHTSFLQHGWQGTHEEPRAVYVHSTHSLALLKTKEKPSPLRAPVEVNSQIETLDTGESMARGWPPLNIILVAFRDSHWVKYLDQG